MRIAYLFLSSLLVSCLWSSCDNEVDLLTPAGDGGALPVVFGLINSSIDTQYVSITRTFRFSDGGSAFTSLTDPDSLYYSNEAAQVTVSNLRSNLTTTLERVALDEEGVVRRVGTFPTSPNIVYRFRLSAIAAQPGDSLRLAITANGAELASSAVQLLSQLEFQRTRKPPESYSLTSRNAFNFSWNNLENGATIVAYEVGFEFDFLETSPTGSVVRTLYYAPSQSVSRTGNTVNLSLQGFIPFIASQLDAEPEVTRSFRDIRLIITGGDSNFGAYQELIRANSGITATQELPVFSNINGGLGLLGSITQLRQVEPATLSNSSFDSLRMSVATRGLNFQ